MIRQSDVAIRRIFSIQNGGTPKTSVTEYWGGETVWVTPEDLGKNRTQYVDASRRTITDRGIQASNAELVPAGSIVMSTRAPIGYTAIAALPLTTNQGCKTLVPNRAIDSRFYEYELSVRTGDLTVLGTGATFLELSTEALAAFRVPFPPLPTQHKIAYFLDRETERIDALIDKKRRLIDLLEEKRTATISQAVTKGLDPTVPMKPSNIPWLGEVPTHWEVTAVKRVSMVQYGLGQPPPESDDGIPIVRATNIDRGSISKDNLMHANLSDLPLDRAPLLVAGEILVVRSGALTGDSAIITSRWVGSAPGYDLRLTPQTMSAEYLAWFLLSTPGLEQMWLESSRAAQPHLNADELGGVGLPYPPLAEQGSIALFINDYVSTSHRLASTLESQLSLLAEYREALITAAVTGEIDVDTFDNDRNMEEATA